LSPAAGGAAGAGWAQIGEANMTRRTSASTSLMDVRGRILPAVSGVRQRDQLDLDDLLRGRAEGGGRAPSQPRDPQDAPVQLDERQSIALPARHLRVDQERLESALAGAERVEPIAPPAT